MKTEVSVLLFALGIFLQSQLPLQASQNWRVPWSEFHIRSEGIEINGEESTSGIARLRVRAYKREFRLSKEELKRLAGCEANQMSVSEGHVSNDSDELCLVLTFRSTINSTTEKIVILRQNGKIEFAESKSPVR